MNQSAKELNPNELGLDISIILLYMRSLDKILLGRRIEQDTQQLHKAPTLIVIYCSN